MLRRIARWYLGKVNPRTEGVSEVIFQPDADRDVLLVSYPRSGNTWMRAAISELLFEFCPASIEALDRTVPDLHDLPPINELKKAPWYVVKSHGLRNSDREIEPDYARVIYLVRDPRDVAVSYFRYNAALRDYRGDLPQFVDDWICGRIWPSSWREHVDSWLAPGSQCRDTGLLLIRYEDLLQAPGPELTKVARFLQVPADEDAIAGIVESTSRARMRQREQQGMRAVEMASGYRFIGPAKQGNWIDTLDEASVGKIEKYSQPGMRSLGYLE